ncbi:MAG: ABC transporter permease [Candidatus Microgenomates bacterium]|jgi:putative ABC transport system permease protein
MIAITEISKLAFRSLLRNKTRSLLTMVGIIIGVSAVILLVSIGQGLQDYLLNTFESLGSNLITVLPGKVGQGGFSAASSPNFAGTKLTIKDVTDIAQLGGSVETAGGGLESAATVSNGGKNKFVSVIGADATYLKIRDFSVESGRTITDSDSRVSRNVAIVGKTIVTDLYGGADPVGKKITIGSQKFEIIGVLNEIGSGGFGIDVNSYIFIPLTTAQNVFGIKGVEVIAAKAVDKESIPQAISQINALLSKRLKSDDFSVVDNTSLVQTVDQILGVLTLALGGIAAISLLVGGVGIMNIMLVSVTERTKEIGLRKAVGAKPGDILYQFLIESVVLSLGGGVIGVAIGALGAWAMSFFIQTSVSFWSVALAFGVSALIGIVFGVAPAARASKLNPIDALKYE